MNWIDQVSCVKAKFKEKKHAILPQYIWQTLSQSYSHDLLLLLMTMLVIMLWSCVLVLLLVFVLGECNSNNQTLVHNIQDNTVYQFRVQLSPAHSCHCVNIETVGSTSLINQNWCIQPVISTGNHLCATESNSTYLSQPVAIGDNFIDNVECSHPFVMQNTMDTAVAYEGKFGSCPEAKCLFPLTPLPSVNNEDEL